MTGRWVLSKPCTSQHPWRGGAGMLDSPNPAPLCPSAARPTLMSWGPGRGHRDVLASCLDRQHPPPLRGRVRTWNCRPCRPAQERCGVGRAGGCCPQRALHASADTSPCVRASPAPCNQPPTSVPRTHGQPGVPDQGAPGLCAPSAGSRRGNTGFGWTSPYGPGASWLQGKGVFLEKVKGGPPESMKPGAGSPNHGSSGLTF